MGFSRVGSAAVRWASFDEPRHPQARPLGLRDLRTAWSGEAQRKRTAIHVRHVLSNEMIDKKSHAGMHERFQKPTLSTRWNSEQKKAPPKRRGEVG
jgi:hypothetical protein